MIYKPAEDSFLLQKYVKKYANGRVLDIGSGSGILAQAALKKTKHVLATDISNEIISHLKKKQINSIKSNLFQNVRGKFDLIIFNPPYLPKDKKINDKTIYGGTLGYETIEKFLSQAEKFLNKNGKILILFSSLTNKGKIDDILRKNKLKFKCLEKKKLFFETLYVYLITSS